MNKMFVKISEDCKTYTAFKNPINVNGTVRFVNSDKGKNELGYYELNIVYPQTDEKHHAELESYKVEDNKVVGVFKIVENPKVYRMFSKYKIMTYLMELNRWEEFKTWIESSKYADFWTVPLEFDEQDPYFQMGLQAFKEKFEFSDEQIEDILENCKKGL